MAAPSINTVIKFGACAGCGACAGVSPDGVISMSMNTEGFLRPTVRTADEKILKKASAACPALELEQRAEDRNDDVLWGPVINIHRGWATDETLRYKASSGGALSAILAHLVTSGAVDAIIETGADKITPYGNETRITATTDEIADAAGSRYAPSAPLSDLKQWLADGRRFAFVGKPCDVAALRKIAASDSRIDKAIPFMISFFCAGAPSRHGAAEIIRQMGAAPEEVTAFRFRGHGWPGEARADLRDGSHRSISYNDSWGKILTQFLPLRCKICPDGVGGFADIVCADAWECNEKGYPLFDERPGVSLVLARTDKGARVVADAEAAGALHLAPANLDEIKSMQPGQLKRKRLALSRHLAMRAALKPAPSFKGFNLAAAAKQAGVFGNVKSFLGALRRFLLR